MPNQIPSLVVERRVAGGQTISVCLSTTHFKHNTKPLHFANHTYKQHIKSYHMSHIVSIQSVKAKVCGDSSSSRPEISICARHHCWALDLRNVRWRRACSPLTVTNNIVCSGSVCSMIWPDQFTKMMLMTHVMSHNLQIGNPRFKTAGTMSNCKAKTKRTD